MAKETYTITRRPGWSYLGEIKVEIECDPNTGLLTKLGLAVRAAVGSRADLSRANLSRANLSGANLSRADLSGADLSGANLSRADLSRANLSRANLSGANLSRANLSRANLSWADLSGANLNGEKITRWITSATRSDGYAFHAFVMDAGGVKIQAGCRWFTPIEFRAHIAREYPGTDKAKETGRLLDLIEGRAEDLGVSAPKPKRLRKAKEEAA
jgi:uncharacterized protein YjbI with pentapeptide repeats